MNAAKLAEAGKLLLEWGPVLLKLRALFGGDPDEALRALRKFELDRRKARDKRMGR